jgi:Uma2 family endonuclease
MNAIAAPPLSLTPVLADSLYEVVNGERVELLPMGIASTWLASILHLSLGSFVKERHLGRVVMEGLFVLDLEKNLRRRPDLAFVSARHWPLERPLPELGDWAIVPDLAVEVVSPNDLFEAVLAKMREYFEYGVTQVWLVVPSERQIYVYDAPARVRVFGATDDLAETVVPEFTLKLAEFFQQAM